MIMAEQIHITEHVKPVNIGVTSCFYGLSVANQLTLVEYSHILKEWPVQKVAEKVRSLWARVIFTELVSEHSPGGADFVLFVMVHTHL